MKKIISFFLFVSVFLQAENLPIEKSLINGELSNGLKYTIKKNQKPKNKASIRLLVKAGSLEEDDDQKGLAHFIEHLAFNGTQHFAHNNMVKFLESIGVKFGYHLNASTGTTRTLYKLEIPLKGDNLQKAMLVFSDWAGRVKFTQKELDKERGVILEEARARNDVGYRMFLRSKDTIYANSKYKDRAPIGDLDIIRNVTLKTIKRFYDDWYRPELMHLYVIGDVNVAKVKKLIEKNFGMLKNKSHRKTASRAVPSVDKTRVLLLKDKELTSSSVSLQFLGDYKPITTTKEYKSALIRTIMARLFNKKASEQIIKKNPASKFIQMGIGQLGDNLRSYTFMATFVGLNELQSFKEMTNLMFTIEKFGFKKREFKRVIKEMLKDNEDDKKSIGNTSNTTYAHLLVAYDLNNGIFMDEKYRLKLKEKLLKSITLEDIDRAYKKVLSLKNRLIIYQTANNTQISKRRVKNILNSANVNVKKPKKDVDLPQEIAIPALKPAKVVSKKHNKKYNFTQYTLSNGVKFVYKFNDYDKNLVLLTSYSDGGFSLYDTKDLTNARFATSIVGRSGLGKYNIIDVSKIYADKNAMLRLALGRYSEEISGRSTSGDFEYLLKRLYLATTKYRFDDNILFNTKTVSLAKLKKEDRSPDMKFGREFANFYYHNNKRYTPISKEDIASLDKKKILHIYKDRFLDLNNFMFFIVGDIKEDEMLKYAKLYLGNLPTNSRKESYKNRHIKPLKGKREFIRYYNNENISKISLSYKKEMSYDTHKSVLLSALGDILKVKLRELIREEKSGVYGISVSANMTRKPNPKSVISISFTCDPKRKDELLKYVHETIESFKDKKVAKKYIDAYRKSTLQAIENNSKKASYWLGLFQISYKYGESLDRIEMVKKMIKNLTPKQIQKASDDFFDTKDIVLTELNPKKKTKSE